MLLLSKFLIGAVFVTSTLFAQTITFKGLDYNVITSPTTKQVWLDRNLGAKNVCLSNVDEGCFGDYYQWGRNADGHEKANSTVLRKSEVNGSKTSAFISVKTGDAFDWNNTPNDTLWNKTNDICPVGFRVPTIDELSAEVNNDHFLKLPLSGYKSFCNGNLVQTKKQGAVWSSTPYEKDAYYLDIRMNMMETSTSSRADAFPVRCIKSK